MRDDQQSRADAFGTDGFRVADFQFQVTEVLRPAPAVRVVDRLRFRPPVLLLLLLVVVVVMVVMVLVGGRAVVPHQVRLEGGGHRRQVAVAGVVAAGRELGRLGMFEGRELFVSPLLSSSSIKRVSGRGEHSRGSFSESDAVCGRKFGNTMS